MVKRRRISLDEVELPDFNNLPDLVWLKILDMFTYEERKNLFVASSRIFLLSLECLRFIKNNTLVLENCAISPVCPPWTIFINAQRPIFHIIFGKNVWFDRSCNEFWEAIQENVETLTFTHEKNAYKNVALNFKNVKKVQFISLKQFLETKLPASVENVHLQKFENFLTDGTKKKYHEKIAGLKILTTDCFNNLAYGKRIKSILTWDKELFSGNYFQHKLKQTQVNLLQVENLAKDHVREQIFSVATFKDYPHIEKLVLRNVRDDGCIFVHEPFMLPKVVEIEFDLWNDYEILCDRCIDTLFQSCPNVIHWSVSCFSNLPSQILSKISRENTRSLNFYSFTSSMITIDFPCIESLIVSRFPYLNLNNCFKMPNLKKLHLFSHPVTVKDIKILAEKCPALEELAIGGELSLEMLQIVENTWPLMRKLLLNFTKNHDSLNAIFHSLQGKFKVLNQIGILEGTNFKKLHNYQITAFEKIPTLRVCFGATYKDYCNYKFVVRRTGRVLYTD